MCSWKRSVYTRLVIAETEVVGSKSKRTIAETEVFGSRGERAIAEAEAFGSKSESEKRKLLEPNSRLPMCSWKRSVYTRQVIAETKVVGSKSERSTAEAEAFGSESKRTIAETEVIGSKDHTFCGMDLS